MLGRSLLVALLLASPARAQPLELADVLAAARRNAPLLVEAEAQARIARARRLAADGAFDSTVDVSAETRLSGTYDGRYVDGRYVQPFSNRGGYAYGGYRLSDGSFPIYEDERFTNQLGEVRLGALFALWRDRAIDERRLARTQADAAITLAETEALIVAIGVQRRALEAHAVWVAAGLRLAAYRDLLAVAREREDGLQRQAREGAVPTILVTENRQAVLRREALVADSERGLEVAAARLSQFWRDADGEPRLPPAARLPARIEVVPAAPLPPGRQLPDRPDIAAVDTRIAQARERLAQDRNALLPRLDLKVEASQDIGPIGEGGPSRSGTETKVGLSFSVPLQRRAAQGKLAETEASIAVLEAQRRRIAEDIGVQLQAVSTDVTAAARLLSLVENEAREAEVLAQAERRRMQLGSSDLLRVALREEAAADARVRQVDAALRRALAHAELAAATADLRLLGL
jgi:outer membrane protein TolC